MLFSSLSFLYLFLPVFLLIYYFSPIKTRNLILLIGSLIFYSWGEPLYIGIMIFSTVFDYANGLGIEKAKMQENQEKAKRILILSIVVNLGILGFFKYSNFIIENLNRLGNTNINYLDIRLPIGISFYTFQTLSYTIDVYRGDVEAQKNLVNFGTYVTLFPQLIAGPIVRYKDVSYELENREESFESFSYGVKRFILGLSKKVILANNMGLLWKEVSTYSMVDLPVLSAWLGAIAFSFQIYFDFAGYSDMAIGLGSMLGFNFLENFNYPYMSKSITEFWRRWHISLGTWFKEYVYIPLGGSKEGNLKLIRNLFIVWGLTGLWHGASWNFIIWGLYFGIILIIEKAFFLKILSRLPNLIGHIYAKLLIIIGWVIFAFEDIAAMKKYLSVMFGLSGNQLIGMTTKYMVSNNIIILIMATFFSTEYIKVLRRLFIDKDSKGLLLMEALVFTAVLIVSISFLVGDSYNPFLYFRF